MERKNATTEPAAPRSAIGDVVLDGQDEVLHGRAEADTEDGHEDADQTREVVASMVPSSPMPITTSTMPPTR